MREHFTGKTPELDATQTQQHARVMTGNKFVLEQFHVAPALSRGVFKATSSKVRFSESDGDLRVKAQLMTHSFNLRSDSAHDDCNTSQHRMTAQPTSYTALIRLPPSESARTGSLKHGGDPFGLGVHYSIYCLDPYNLAHGPRHLLPGRWLIGLEQTRSVGNAPRTVAGGEGR